MRPVLALMVFLAGCAVHLRGAVFQGDEGPVLLEPEGRERRLVLGPTSAPLAFLDGHGVTIEGTAFGDRVRVRDWTITEGISGFQVFVGPVVVQGEDVGVADRGSRATYLLDRRTAAALARHAGTPVLVEGYVEGALRVRVVTWRLLAPEASP
jgi:hypothetical protein